jgi:hypothetical protein
MNARSILLLFSVYGRVGCRTPTYYGKVHPKTVHEGPAEEQRYSSIISLTSKLDEVGGQLHVPTALPPEKIRGTHCIGGWVGPRVGLEGCGKFRPQKDSIPGPSCP